jgi:hypothetical protein
MCNQPIPPGNSHFAEQYFGRQIHPYGVLDAIEKTGSEIGKAVFYPTNPLQFKPELGNMGYVMGPVDYLPIAPEYYQKGYGGILPLDQQPKVDLPEPYRQPVTF